MANEILLNLIDLDLLRAFFDEWMNGEYFNVSLNGTVLTVTDKQGNTNTLDIAAAFPSYRDFLPSGPNASAGLVPSPGTTQGDTKFLCENGTWVTPPASGGSVQIVNNLVDGGTSKALSAEMGKTLKGMIDQGGGGGQGTVKGAKVGSGSTISPDSNGIVTLPNYAENATKVESSSTNGNIKINGTETKVFEMPSSDPYTTARTPSSHSHGNIANGGTLSDTAADAAGNDLLVIRDADNNKIQTSTIKGTDVADAVSKKHSHSNKNVLDSITQEKMESWDNASSGGVTNVSYNGTTKAITKTVGGQTTEVVSASTLKADMGLTKSDIGLGNVTNDAQVKRSEMGANSGVATLGSDGKLPTTQLPTMKTINNESILGSGNITIQGGGATADEEDLTNAGGVLKLKNRTASAGKMGMKILRTGSSFASQVTDANTIYVIRYAFDLGGSTVTVPSGSVLRFDGGSLSNGSLSASNIEVENGNFNDVLISVSGSVTMKKTVMVGGTLNQSGTSYEKALLTLDHVTYAYIEGCSFMDGRLGLYADTCQNVTVLNSLFENFTYWGNYFRSAEDFLISGNTCDNVNDGIKLTGILKNVTVSNNVCRNNVRDGIDYAGHSVDGCYIVNNFCYDNTICGIEYKSLNRDEYPLSRYGLEETDVVWRNINISGNQLVNNGGVGINSFSYYGSQLAARMDRISYSGNFIESNSATNTYGMHLGFYCKQANGVVVSSNIMQGQFNTAMIISNAFNNVISGNVINNDNHGIRIDSQDYDLDTLGVIVKGNIINTYRESAVTINPNTNGIHILDNNFKTTQKATITNNSSGSNITVSDNEPADFRRVGTEVNIQALSSSYSNQLNIGYGAFNTDGSIKEYWDGTEWVYPTGISSSKVIYLPKNNNALTNAMLSKENVTYVIRYGYAVSGTVTVPSGCTLRFEGGSISGGTISCNNTAIEGQKNCFGSNTILTGTISSDFRISWLTLVQGYDVYNIECLSSLCAAVTRMVIWDVAEIYILHKANVSIPIHPGINDFNGTKFLCKSTVNNGVLFKYEEAATAISGSGLTIAGLVSNAAFTDKCGYLIVEDQNPIVPVRIGYDTPAYRKDILCVKDNKATNNTVLPYDDGESSIGASYFYGNYETIAVRNFSVERDSAATKVSKIAIITNAHDVVISDVSINTPGSSLNDGRDFEITSVYNLTFRNINSNGSYSQTNKSGYVFALNNIYNMVCDTLCGGAKWGVFGCNNMNRVSISNSQINRFDCHCYSRDWLFVNCAFAHLYNQIGVHFGYVKFDSCSFTSCTPLLVDDSYCAMTPYEAVFEDCTFSDIPYIVSAAVSKETFDGTRHRTLLSEYNMPSIKVGGTYNLTRNSFILRKASNYTECPAACKISIENLTINVYNSTYLAIVSSSLSNVLVSINRLRYKLQSGVTLYTLYGLVFSTDTIVLSNMKVSVNNSYFPTNYTLKKEFYDGTDSVFTVENSVIPVSTWNAYGNVSYINCIVVCRYQSSNFAISPAVIYKDCKFRKEVEQNGYLTISSDRFYHFQNCAFDVQPRYFNLYKNIDCFVSDNVMSEGYSEGITSAELTALFTPKGNGAIINRFKCYNTSTHTLEYYINRIKVTREVFYGEVMSGLFANKPDTSIGIPAGFSYFATNKGAAGVGAMIYYTGDSNTPWVYADGTAVS